MAAPTHLELTDSATLFPLLRRHGFSTRKRLGQHFLLNRNVLHAIIKACELSRGLPVLEVGPGIGTVTRDLAEQGARVTAVEVDARAVEVLRETVGAFPTVNIVHADILAVDLPALLAGAHWCVVGNLPYNITTPVIERMIAVIGQLELMVFMVQREVAERLVAAPGSKTLRLALGLHAGICLRGAHRAGGAGGLFAAAARGVRRGAPACTPGAVGAAGAARDLFPRGARGLRPAAQNAGKCAGRRRRARG